jgi:sulfur-carrier protein
MASGLIRYWAAARDAAGTAEEPYHAETLAAALSAARRAHGDGLGLIFQRCSYLVDESPVGGRDHATVELSEGGTIEVLPPFAGG